MIMIFIFSVIIMYFRPCSKEVVETTRNHYKVMIFGTARTEIGAHGSSLTASQHHGCDFAGRDV